MFTSGVSVKEAVRAIRLAEGEVDVMKLIPKSSLQKLIVGEPKIINLVSYVKDGNVQARYPIDDDKMQRVKELMGAGRMSEAASVLHASVASRLAATGRTNVPVVQIGSAKQVDGDQVIIGKILENLTPVERSSPVTIEMLDDQYVCNTKGFVVKGKNKKRVGNTARYINHCLMAGIEPELLGDLRTISVLVRKGTAKSKGAKD